MAKITKKSYNIQFMKKLAEKWGIFQIWQKQAFFQRDFLDRFIFFEMCFFFQKCLRKNGVIFEISFGKFIH